MLKDPKLRTLSTVSLVSVETPKPAEIQAWEPNKAVPAANGFTVTRGVQTGSKKNPLDAYREKKLGELHSRTQASPLEEYRDRKRQEAWTQLRSKSEIEHFDADSIASLGLGDISFEDLRQMACDGKIEITDPGERQQLTVSWANGWNPKYYQQGYKDPAKPIVPRNSRVTASKDDTYEAYLLETQKYGIAYPESDPLTEQTPEELRESLPVHQMSGELYRAYIDTLLAFKMGNTEEIQKYARFWRDEQKKREDYIKQQEEQHRREYEEWYETTKKKLEAAAAAENAQVYSPQNLWITAMSQNMDNPFTYGLDYHTSLLRQSPNWRALQEHIAPELEAEKAETLKSYEEWAQDNPILASAVSVPTSLLSGLDYVMDVYETANFGEPITSAMPDFTETTQAWRGGASADFNDTGKFLYNTAMSGVDSLAAGLFGTGGAILLGTSAASNAANDIRARGGTETQALIGGGVAGVFEGLFEKFSLGNLQALKKTPITDAKKLLKNLAKTTFVNASEEAATEIANIAYDTLFHGDISNYSLLLKEYTAAYVEQGMSETDAEKKARRDVIWTLTGQVLESMASGALIGAGFTGAGAMESDYRTYIAGRAITESGAQAELYQQALAFPPGSATYQLAERLDGKEMSEHETGTLYRTMLLDMEAGITGESTQNTEQTSESAVQSDLERGIMRIEQQYLKALEEANRETAQVTASEGDLSDSEYEALQSGIRMAALELALEETIAELALENNASTAAVQPDFERNMLWSEERNSETVDSGQQQESSEQTDDESGGTNTDLWVEQYLNALEEETQEPNFTQTELAEIGAALLSAGIMPQGKYFDALGIDKPRARGIQVVMRMALEDSPVRQKAAEIVAQIRTEADAREKYAKANRKKLLLREEGWASTVDEVKNDAEKTLDISKIPYMTKQDILSSIPVDWNYVENNGFVHIRDANGNIRLRIDPPDKMTTYPHVHVYDSNGNALNSAGRIVDRKSPDGHIPYKNK